MVEALRMSAHHKCITRMCLFIPTEDVSTLPQLGHRHLYTLRRELCRRKNKTEVKHKAVERELNQSLAKRFQRFHSDRYLRLFGSELLALLQLHVQALIGAAVYLGDGWRWGGAPAAVVPAPVAAAAAVRELATSTLHVNGRGQSTWSKKKTFFLLLVFSYILNHRYIICSGDSNVALFTKSKQTF